MRATYDVSPDGKFLFNQTDPEINLDRALKIFPARLRVLLNWDQETERLLNDAK